MNVKRKWSELSSGTRRTILVLAAVEGVIKAVGLTDLARRPADEVRGSKVLWGAAIALTNSAGLVPLVYFLEGRRVRR